MTALIKAISASQPLQRVVEAFTLQYLDMHVSSTAIDRQFVPLFTPIVSHAHLLKLLAPTTSSRIFPDFKLLILIESIKIRRGALATKHRLCLIQSAQWLSLDFPQPFIDRYSSNYCQR